MKVQGRLSYAIGIAAVNAGRRMDARNRVRSLISMSRLVEVKGHMELGNHLAALAADLRERIH